MRRYMVTYASCVRNIRTDSIRITVMAKGESPEDAVHNSHKILDEQMIDAKRFDLADVTDFGQVA